MDEHIYKRHNKSLLLYHLVLPVKYRKTVISEEVGLLLKEICLDISDRYDVSFVEIGYEEDHVHFLLQSVPSLSISTIAGFLKSITVKELFRRCPSLESSLWGGNFWTSGYYANTVGPYGNKDVIQRYVENQGKSYVKLYDGQLSLFD